MLHAGFTHIHQRILGILLVGCALMAQAEDGGITLQLIVEQEIETVDAQGNKIIKRIEPKLVVPGDDVIYTTFYRNNGDKPAEQVMIVTPIPKETFYLTDSARGKNSRITYSVDDGKSFDTPDRLQVKGDNGKSRPATAKDYTHVRWTLDQLDPGASGSVSFKARLE